MCKPSIPETSCGFPKATQQDTSICLQVTNKCLLFNPPSYPAPHATQHWLSSDAHFSPNPQGAVGFGHNSRSLPLPPSLFPSSLPLASFQKRTIMDRTGGAPRLLRLALYTAKVILRRRPWASGAEGHQGVRGHVSRARKEDFLKRS